MEPELTAVEEVAKTGLSKEARIAIASVIAVALCATAAYYVYQAKKPQPVTTVETVVIDE